MLIDLHVHSDVSRCSVLSVDDILDNARSFGLDGVCITDHDTTGILSQIREGFQSDGLLVLVGMEYTTPQGDYLVHGPVESLKPGMDAHLLMTTVSEMGGVVIAAHPFRGWRPSDTSVITPRSCVAVEVENGRNTLFENTQAHVFSREQSMLGVAGSDAHRLDELARFPTNFTTPIASREDLVAALKAGKFELLPEYHLLETAS
ncbi:PHP domain-containing protein [Pseudodesulfovibrio sp. zrk46]|uniref:PHP domain-containing protein n=1 Tax=Pseudodesulfovibrio sp. zrk46 TaxID=2725288 RepID=UPI0014490BEF|nr:PHP domain-containing protein [Pseudodesulfovibrio sp. zrk46]QJB57312.1 PHP domain-containing protein [Pseudodesulfovibrio sp. zrk46]